MITTEVKNVDPRVKRTRQLLQQAFTDILQEKNITSISIQDITERATVNRATFYAHFTDKYALMDSIIHEQFQLMLASRLPSTPQWGATNLRILIRATFDFLREFHHRCVHSNTQFDPLMERAIQQELSDLLLRWLKQLPIGRTGQRVPAETLASVMSWAIFGTAVQWSRNGQKPSEEEITNQVLIAITEGAAHLAPGIFPS